MLRHHIPKDNILHFYRRENIKCDTDILSERLIITFDKATAGQLYLHGNRHDNADTVARGSLPFPT
jgi:hypothetical protein